MISVLQQKYKSIGRILLIPDDEESFYVYPPIDFFIFEHEKEYNLHLRYSNYIHTFDYKSYKAVIPLLDKNNVLTVIHIHNPLVPDEDCSNKSSSTGYTLCYKIRYNENNKDDSLFLSFVSNKPITIYQK